MVIKRKLFRKFLEVFNSVIDFFSEKNKVLADNLVKK